MGLKKNSAFRFPKEAALFSAAPSFTYPGIIIRRREAKHRHPLAAETVTRG